ncbi:hypothetical protein B9479_008031 [Cryptococcus floricola]|uniref:AAA+ ATPase domain-containing protein n=1 Tax=Cryptococcus floricola TaxID=2591691 RepID=A0A5D3ALY5_9TREE|nr:hypothetical protein B9479_008031 [Cryptococcus floricola]
MSRIISLGGPPPRSSPSDARILGSSGYTSPSKAVKGLSLNDENSNEIKGHGEEQEIEEEEEEEEEEMGMMVDSDMEETEDEEDDDRIVIHVEVRQKQHSRILQQPLMIVLQQFIEEEIARVQLGCELPGWQEVEILREHVDRVWVEEGVMGVESIQASEAEIQVHVYKASVDDLLEEFTADLDDDDDEEKVSAASVRSLPSKELDGVWDTLVYSDDIKARLLNYIYSTILFSECEVDFNVIAWNRVILLHGPPGTGKTSLCRALAQKISIRLSDKYRHGKVIEINSHSLFSKWFSESGKLVQKLFEKVTDLVEDESCFVVVMIDEVESLTAARAGAMRGNEPSDSLRVVNALLTQLDKLRTHKNVLVMTTSNLIDAIDEAFLSRVDLSEHVPLPPPRAVYSILSGCLREMGKKGLVRGCRVMDWQGAEEARRERKFEGGEGKGGDKKREREKAIGASLAELAIRCHAIELSGRTLRKLPVLAHARYLSSSSGEHRAQKIERWIDAMNKVVAVEAEKKEGPVSEFSGVANGVGGEKGKGHSRIGSMEKRDVGVLVGTKMRGDRQEHGHA